MNSLGLTEVLIQTDSNGCGFANYYCESKLYLKFEGKSTELFFHLNCCNVAP